VLATSLGVQTPSLGAPASLEGSQITVALSGKNNICHGIAAGVDGNHSFYLLSIDF